MQAYRDINFQGVLRPDHVPTVEGDNNENAGYSSFGRLYAIGYIRGLRQAVVRSIGQLFMQIALTGGRGGVGRAVTEMALAQGHTIISMDRTPVDSPRKGVTSLLVDMQNYADVENAFAAVMA